MIRPNQKILSPSNFTKCRHLVKLQLHLGVSCTLKKSSITPLLKKSSLDPEVKNHHRPVFNVSFISKVIERAVTHQLNDLLLVNELFEIYQSSYYLCNRKQSVAIKVAEHSFRAVSSVV